MPDETRHESADLEDYEVEDASDTLINEPEGDPLDRGVAPPERWSAGMRYGTTDDEQESGESLDQLLAEEEPDPALDLDEDDDVPEDSDDEDEADEYLDGLLLDDGPDPRAGRLVAEDEGAHPDAEADLVPRATPGSPAVPTSQKRRPSTWSRTTTPTSVPATEWLAARVAGARPKPPALRAPSDQRGRPELEPVQEPGHDRAARRVPPFPGELTTSAANAMLPLKPISQASSLSGLLVPYSAVPVLA